MTPYLTLIRFGKWNEILNFPASQEKQVFAGMLWHYGRGLALARKHDFINAAKQLEAVRHCLKDSQMSAPAPPFANPGIAGGAVAEKLLQGVIAEEQDDLPGAIALLRNAVLLEDNMIYNEPKDWVHPVRQYLGRVLLKAGNYAAAEKVYREDLKINPNNVWSLTGLTSALLAQGQKQEAAKIKRQAAKALTGCDVKIDASVF
jgi:tetratricopeptide (TPR) repeat protein